MKKKKSLFRRLEIFVRATRRLLNIRSSSDPEGTIRSISDNIAVKGYNIWILICSALLASIGLDTNSTAVIIGAMLISPLMSPILGVGLGLGINDRDMFISALRNLGIATFVSLLASFTYFKLTPLGDPTSEIMNRTYPTLLDVLIAFFGGIAGIVSGSRTEKTNAIPGVAIATALMPPLCTAGYGLAKLKMGIFLGAFYLFVINAVFISISTYLVIKYLGFPLHREPNEKTQKAVGRVMLISLLIVTAPSVYFLFSLWYRVQTVQKINNLVMEVSEVLTRDQKHEILNIEMPKTANEINAKRNIKMYVSGEIINDSIRNFYVQRFKDLGDFNFSISLLNNVSPEVMNELNASDKVIRDNVLQLQTRYEKLEGQFDSLKNLQTNLLDANMRQVVNQDLMAELRVFYPDLDTVKVTDFRKIRMASSLSENTPKENENDGLYHTLPKISLSAQEKFPYLGLICKQPQNDSLKIAIDSLRKILRSSYVLVKKSEFPYLEIQHPPLPQTDSLEKQAMATETSKQNPPKDNSPSKTPRPKQTDVEVILYWRRPMTYGELPPRELDKIRNYLGLKLTRKGDSLRIIHYGPLFGYR